MGMTSRSRSFTTIAGGLALLCVLAPLLGQEGQEGGEGGAASGNAKASVWDGVYTTGQAERGAPLYAERCSECHGEGLQGDDVSPPLIGGDFLWDWNGLSVGDLFERIVISMPEEDPRSMSAQQKADVLAFVLQRNEIPAGDAELASTKKELSPIRIDAVRPSAEP